MSNPQGAEGLRRVREEEGPVFVQLGEGDAERRGSYCRIPGQQTHRGHVYSITFIIVM